MDSEENKPVENSNRKKWLKWGGIATFTFFLVKGLLWLVVPALLWFGIVRP